jgi:hypothetical protein
MRAAPLRTTLPCALAWHLRTTSPLENFRAAKLVVLLSTQHLRAGVGERKRVNGGRISDSRSLLTAGECLVVTTGTICAVKMNSLTPPPGPNYYVLRSSAPRLLLYAMKSFAPKVCAARPATPRAHVATEPSSVFFCLVGLLLFSN